MVFQAEIIAGCFDSFYSQVAFISGKGKSQFIGISFYNPAPSSDHPVIRFVAQRFQLHPALGKVTGSRDKLGLAVIFDQG